MTATPFFPTKIYQARIDKKRAAINQLNKQLLIEAEEIAALDTAGQRWSKKNYRNGFTSYASANELQKQSSTFARLEKLIDQHIKRFAKELDWDLGRGKLKMSNCWVNIMPGNTHHGSHIHPLSVLSGTYYLSVPEGAPEIKFEDPRLDKMMAAPPVRTSAKKSAHRHISLSTKAGDLVIFESWLRHEVPINHSKKTRISLSFNYDWV